MPRNMPFMVRLDPGTYHWCSCGRSATGPMCDGSHKDTGKEPMAFEVKEKKLVGLCGCRRTQTPPYCDGSHAR